MDGHGGRHPYRFLALLLAADVAFIVLHLLHFHTRFASDDGFSLERERGYAEVFST